MLMETTEPREPVHCISCLSAPCRGDSMSVTLKAGDRLWLAPVAFAALEVGDVVASDAGNKVVAHRIVARHPDGFLLQGDGNGRPDLEPLTNMNFLGKVVARERRGALARLAGGRQGHRRGQILRACSRFRIHLLWMLDGPYRRLRSSRWMVHLWRPGVLVVRFTTPGGLLTKFIRRGKTVAVWAPQAGRWECRRPYDLVLFPPIR